MKREEALRLLGIDAKSWEHELSSDQIRKYYLRSCLLYHPDKNPGDTSSHEKFTLLKEAYESLLKEISTEKAARKEAAWTAGLLDILGRALQGENVEDDLRDMGVYRPAEMFGIDLTVPFDERLPGWVYEENLEMKEEGYKDVGEVFRDVFNDEGLDEEGNPLEGWARPTTVDLDDL